MCAYTLDGGAVGQLEIESFSADAMVVSFIGFNTHPGYAKGRMVNAIKAASRFIDRLPHDRLSPETTERYEGFVHPYQMEASVDRTSVRVLIRDFDTAQLAEKEALVEEIARAVGSETGTSVEFAVHQSYRNMREVLDRHPEVVERARTAIRRAGLQPDERPIRGGTDGSRLSFMGLPTPNLFAGEHNFHSRLEWTSRQDLEKAVEVIVHLARVWAEGRARPRGTTRASWRDRRRATRRSRSGTRHARSSRSADRFRTGRFDPRLARTARSPATRRAGSGDWP